MANKIQIKRGTRNNFSVSGTSLVATSALNQGELYLITDENRVAVGLGPASFQNLAITTDIPTVNNGTLTLGTTAASTGTAVGVSGSGFSANTGSNTTYNVTIGPAISNLANTMTGAGSGFLKKTAQDTYTIDTSTYLTTSTSISSLAAPTVALDMNNQKITNLATPTGNTDAVTKLYVDGLIQGIDAKQSVKAATTTEITLSGLQTIDGVALEDGFRVLVKNQVTNTFQNGIYVVSATAWSRASDADDWNELISAFVFVEQGTIQADTSWLCNINAGGSLGVTAVTFNQFASAGSYLGGNGLTLDGNTFNVGAGTGITVNADTIQISATYVGQSSITTLGTVTTGTWSATTIATTKGGTGLTSYAVGDILYANAADTLTKLTKPASLDSFLQMTSAGVPSWVSTIDGGSF